MSLFLEAAQIGLKGLHGVSSGFCSVSVSFQRYIAIPRRARFHSEARPNMLAWRSTLGSLSPVFQNASGAAVLFLAADGVAQCMEARAGSGNDARATSSSSSPQWDPWRCTGAGLLGMVLGGGVYPAAYAQLDRLLPGRSWRTLVLKSVVEILTVGVAVNTASLLGRASWQGTHTWEAVRAHVQAEIPYVTLMDAQVWFPYNLLAFGAVPIQIRPLTTAFVEAGWQTWISLRAHDFGGDPDHMGHKEQH